MYIFKIFIDNKKTAENFFKMVKNEFFRKTKTQLT